MSEVFGLCCCSPEWCFYKTTLTVYALCPEGVCKLVRQNFLSLSYSCINIGRGSRLLPSRWVWYLPV